MRSCWCAHDGESPIEASSVALTPAFVAIELKASTLSNFTYST